MHIQILWQAGIWPKSHRPHFEDSVQWCSDPATISERSVWMRWTESRKEESKVKSDCKGTKTNAHESSWMAWRWYDRAPRHLSPNVVWTHEWSCLRKITCEVFLPAWFSKLAFFKASLAWWNCFLIFGPTKPCSPVCPPFDSEEGECQNVIPLLWGRKVVI